MDALQLMQSEATDTLSALVTRYKRAVRKGCESILDMASAIAEADQLSSADKVQFYAEINLGAESPTAKKLRVIAKHRDRFTGHLDVTPPCWTTV